MRKTYALIFENDKDTDPEKVREAMEKIPSYYKSVVRRQVGRSVLFYYPPFEFPLEVDLDAPIVCEFNAPEVYVVT